MSALKILNQNSEASRRDQSLMMNIHAARSLASILKTNLGPKGTLKMLVDGAGSIKLTKDGRVLLKEMHINHPTASLIANAATSQDDIVGDGTTSTVLLCGELMKQCEPYLSEGIHSRLLVEGIELGRQHLFDYIPQVTKKIDATEQKVLESVVKSVIGTKMTTEFTEELATMIVDAVKVIKIENTIDLFMVEIQTMKHKFATNTELIKGLVMDHGTRHPGMPHDIHNVFVLTCNVSMEYEKSEVNSSVFYSDVNQRNAMVKNERKYADDQVAKVVDLKRRLVEKYGKDVGLLVVNQKGIDQPSLDKLAAAQVMALRRAKRRNMERLTLACGGVALNSFEGEIPLESLGRAGHVFESVVGEEKYTFVEECEHPKSCTILIRGSDDQIIEQLKDTVRDGLRACKNAMEDGGVVLGAGCFELQCWKELTNFAKTVKGKAKLGVEVLANSMLIIPKTLIENSGYDVTERLYELEDAINEGKVGGVDIVTGGFKDVQDVWDGVRVKKQMIQLATVLACQLMLVDVVMRCGKKNNKSSVPDGGQFN
ncbi:T-complex protein 1 subunit zeta, putative [Entamoeba invadens IP1]|uniref:T-complex protein 1 subunit zeta, putative n=1 Tax=Entamoeba invadens IP1 TaxID=370355 RepID=UPI0002C3DD05|nr:T-complex protein 1 subunit zeta, putative [Entamoeba invadens IP1]ELP94234.1 T-complex protein 1 subunit zeta, putative [Entamoeba invadens IP1]|eukprot:XP_004261005.1 T-complex protein 1 subunit zeta, putative [Entamoeba invadens IP1]